MNKSKVNTLNKIFFLIWIILFKVSLDVLYVTVLQSYHTESYLLSYIYVYEFNYYKFVISWVIYILFSLFLTYKIITTGDKPSEILILGLFLASYSPALSLFGLSNLDYKFLSIVLCFWIFLFIPIQISKKIKFKKIKSSKIIDDDTKLKLWYLMIFIFSVGTIIISWKYNGLKLNLTLDSVRVYELRSEVRNLEMNALVEYFRHNAMYVVIPFASLYFYIKRNWMLFTIMVFLQLLLYSIGNQKAALFLLPASIIAYVFYRKNMVMKVPFILTSLNLLVLIEFIINKSSFLIASLLERIYFLPAMLSYAYYEFFINNQPVIPFVSIFEKIGVIRYYPYEQGVPYILGGLLFNNPKISANTGLVGSAFSYGYLGLLIIPILYGLLFILLDKVSSNIDTKSILPIIILQIFVIAGATFFVVISVYGYLTVLLILALINKNNNISLKREVR
ncbi:hypothetical protein EVJ32_11585 [Exiguobacterium sp. SH5S4]|uniref:hypothetical protein n=1 Tax=Exiguobacterium sp. SH5S4 TaxID=2510961 RepID=UPI00103CC26F|nr:hypothetical protein [Exiguobacterium sp. SH5S4]TCI25136.1 hypothetical protein EVJ32_11585 [Exiguobacterium sp. SH5S4]